MAMLADAINKNPPSTLRQLKKKLKDEWKNLSQDHINNAVRSIPNRLSEIIKQNGGPTNY